MFSLVADLLERFSKDVFRYHFAAGGFGINAEEKVTFLVITFALQPFRPTVIPGKTNKLRQGDQVQSYAFLVGTFDAHGPKDFIEPVPYGAQEAMKLRSFAVFVQEIMFCNCPG